MFNFTKNPILLAKENPEEFHEQYRLMKLHVKAMEILDEYKKIADDDLEIKEKCRKIDLLIKTATNQDAKMKLMLKKSKLKLDKIAELIREEMNKPGERTKDELQLLAMVAMEMGERAII